MARSGRKPIPSALKILNGNPGKRPIRPEPSTPVGAPPMPKRLKADAVAVGKWKELVPILLSMGTLTVGDGEVRILRPGAVVLLEDLTGRGHRTRVVGDEDVCGGFVQLPA